MSRCSLVVLLAMELAACSEKKSAPPAPPPPPPPPAVAPAAAGVQRTPVAGDPSAMHLDDDGDSRVTAPPPPAGRSARPIDITLRSSPPGAQVAVDSTNLGSTPAYWNGVADGREHHFVFTLRGHAVAHYRFVPVSSGVIHATLEPIAEEVDAGVPVIPPAPAVIPPAPAVTPPASAVTPPAPPPTPVKPAEPPPAAPADAGQPSTPFTPPVGPQP